MKRRGWKQRLFPELDRFEQRKDAAKALTQARAASGEYYIVLWIVPIAIGIVLFTEFVLVPIGLNWMGNIIFWPTVVIYPSVCLWLRRRRIRYHLREQLAQSGVPICIQCGYDIRGLPENRCPECGTKFEPIPPPRGDGVDG